MIDMAKTTVTVTVRADPAQVDRIERIFTRPENEPRLIRYGWLTDDRPPTMTKRGRRAMGRVIWRAYGLRYPSESKIAALAGRDDGRDGRPTGGRPTGQ